MPFFVALLSLSVLENAFAARVHDPVYRHLEAEHSDADMLSPPSTPNDTSSAHAAHASPLIPLPQAPPRLPDGLENNSQPHSSGAGVNNSPSLGYRPPPGALRREAKSSGQCAFDGRKWRMEPRSAVSSAVMYHRETGLNCEECLALCLTPRHQKASSPWVCRSLTYDNEWRICDLFAVNGTHHPYFLVEHPERDYFEYLAALPPTDAQLIAAFGRKAVSAAGVASLATKEGLASEAVGEVLASLEKGSASGGSEGATSVVGGIERIAGERNATAAASTGAESGSIIVTDEGTITVESSEVSFSDITMWEKRIYGNKRKIHATQQYRQQLPLAY